MRRSALLVATSLLATMAVAPTVAIAAQDETTETSSPSENNAELAALFEGYDKANLSYSPEGKTFRGIRDESYGMWSDQSDESSKASQARLQATARAMREAFDVAKLNEQDALSYRLFDRNAKMSAERFEFRNHGYIFDQMNGAQSQAPAFLINFHRVDTKEHAEAYVSRILRGGPALDQVTVQSAEAAEKGIMPPKWVYPYVINDVDNILTMGKGRELKGNPILDDFRGKVAALDIPAAEKTALVADAIAAWNGSLKPAYQRLRTEMARQEKIAPTDDGIWRLPNGERYYNLLLEGYTTTTLTADEIHEIGLREANRIHDEMRAIMKQVGFEGTLQEFFEYTRTDDKFFAKNREEYLDKTATVIEAMKAKLPEYFNTLPKHDLVVKPVEAFREKSAGKAFYSRPAPDGSRPGVYYVNLYDLKSMSLNELEALAYHEGNPGHHLQLAIQTELGDMPPFRRFGGVTAYSEGWGLYTEELGKDMGFYTEPYSDFGRLGMELWRAGRLVVDTGIHRKKWTREQAMQWLRDNTPNPEGDIRKAIERYIVYPGQATAYMIGKLKIMELRERARTALGDAFDIKDFHDIILLSGPVPLSIMEENVDAWIAEKKG